MRREGREKREESRKLLDNFGCKVVGEKNEIVNATLEELNLTMKDAMKHDGEVG